jgi:ABC-type nickel/cobalt efflux system permease component RcnA
MFLALYVLISSVLAHPFGSNLYGHKTVVWLDDDTVVVEYLAEIPTPTLLRELKKYLANVESPTTVEQDLHTEQVLSELQDGLRLLADGEPVSWTRLEATEPSGKGNSRFISYNLRVQADLPEGASTLNLVNGNRPDEPAMFAADVYVSPSVILDGSSLIDTDHHGEMQENRSGQWRTDEQQRELRLSFRTRSELGTAMHAGFRRVVQGDTEPYEDSESALSASSDQILPTLVTGELTPKAVIIAIFLAFVLGAAHAFAPGHGKALVAAYLLGERKSIRHAVILGVVVTVTHTITVFALGGIALALSEVVPAETLLPWLEVASGLLVLGLGAQLVRARFAKRDEHHGHDHGHDHDHDHGDEHHDHGHAHHDHGHGHEHDHDAVSHAQLHADEYVDASTPRDLIALGISGGLAPCPSALVLLLTAISFHRIAFGLVLVFIFSMGLAVVVTAVGIAVILLGSRLKGQGPAPSWVEWLPRFSAVVITLVGIGMTWKGVASALGFIG